MNEHKSKIAPQDVEEIQRDLQELKDAINTNDADKMKDAIEKAKNAAMKIGKAMYSGAGAGAGDAGAGSGEQQQQQQEEKREEWEGGEQQQKDDPNKKN